MEEFLSAEAWPPELAFIPIFSIVQLTKPPNQRWEDESSQAQAVWLDVKMASSEAVSVKAHCLPSNHTYTTSLPPIKAQHISTEERAKRNDQKSIKKN